MMTFRKWNQNLYRRKQHMAFIRTAKMIKKKLSRIQACSLRKAFKFSKINVFQI